MKFNNREVHFGLLFYPLVLIMTMPLKLFKTMKNMILVFLEGQIGHYNTFVPDNGLNYLFYWTQIENIEKFGFYSKSNLLSDGNFKLNKWFHVTFLSLKLFKHFGAIGVLLAMIIWLISHLIWLHTTDSIWFSIVIIFAFLSTTFYSNAFSMQNYNVYGWIFFQVFLYLLIFKYYLFVSIIILIISFLSFTITFLAILLTSIYMMYFLDIYLFIAMIPVGIKLLFHINIQSMINIMKGISHSKAAKYIRKRSKKYVLHDIYFFIIYFQFGLVYYLMFGHFVNLFILAFGIFFLNSYVFRFADHQTIYMMFFSIINLIMFQHPFSWPLLISFWIAISPLPYIIGFYSFSSRMDTVPELKPFNIQKFIDDMDVFLNKVKSDRVFMAFDDPKNEHYKLFDGYRNLLELPKYVATLKNINFLPDWYLVFDNNYKGAKEFWGRDLDSVKNNLKEFETKYAVVYQIDSNILDTKWENAGFEYLATFDWKKYNEDFGDCIPYDGDTPIWFLLKYKGSS